MSSPEYRLILSPKAQQDVENILRYTGEQWGEKQIEIYPYHKHEVPYEHNELKFRLITEALLDRSPVTRSGA